MFRMSVHDRVLHETIADAKATTPRQMRRCANQTATTGLAGPDAIESSQAALRQEENERLRSEEHTSELQSLMRISYAVFCLKQKKKQKMRPAPLTQNANY